MNYYLKFKNLIEYYAVIIMMLPKHKDRNFNDKMLNKNSRLKLIFV